jgi:hypothetical protein
MFEASLAHLNSRFSLRTLCSLRFKIVILFLPPRQDRRESSWNSEERVDVGSLQDRGKKAIAGMHARNGSQV